MRGRTPQMDTAAEDVVAILDRLDAAGVPVAFVRCLTPGVQVLCHAGYELQENDRHDLALLESLWP